uniref:Peptidase n=1 Tax=Desulfobacca acetoxidans TaxID=60893 RepID=A0A7C3UZF7_9BACT
MMTGKRQTMRFGVVVLALAALGAMGSGGWAVAGRSEQGPNYSCSIKVPEPEPADLAALAKITADQAVAAGQAAFPGAKVEKVELENENGCLVYEVHLSNGMEIKVDAGNGKVVHQELEKDEERREGPKKTGEK